MPILKMDCCEVVYTLCAYQCAGHKVLASDDDETLSEKKKSVPTSDDYHHPPVRAGPVREQSAGPASGPSRPLSRGQGSPPRKGKLENRAFNAQVSCFVRVCLTSHVTQQKNGSSPCGRYFFASLNSSAVARTRMTSNALKQGHGASQNGPPFCSSIFGKSRLNAVSQ